MISIVFRGCIRSLLTVTIVSMALVGVPSRATASPVVGGSDLAPLFNPDLASACDAVTGNLVTDCGFELDGPPDTGFNIAWIVGGNTINPPGGFGGSEYGVDAPDAQSGNYGAYLGPLGLPLTLTQNISVTGGTQYTISYWLNQDSSPTINSNHDFSSSFDGTTLQTITSNLATTGYVQYSFTFTAPTTTTADLAFSFQNDDNYWSFDDVVVKANAVTGVPEPGTLLISGLGVVMLALVRLRQRRSA